jgi:CheY-like chemotaxis protein
MNSKRALIADDDAALLAIVRLLLEEVGFSVVTATRADVALAELRRGPFDLVVLDVEMPGGDGLEVLDAIRGIAPATPCLVMSGNDLHEPDALARGATRFLLKGKPGFVEALLGGSWAWRRRAA